MQSGSTKHGNLAHRQRLSFDERIRIYETPLDFRSDLVMACALQRKTDVVDKEMCNKFVHNWLLYCVLYA